MDSEPCSSTNYDSVECVLGRKKVLVTFVNGIYFVSRNDSEYLESEARVCVNRTNFNENDWQFNSQLCQILPELVLVLYEFGFVQVVQNESLGSSKVLKFHELEVGKNDAKSKTRRLVIRDLWRKGFYLADGTRFGGDFLVYLQSPNKCHAEYVVLCQAETMSDENARISAMRCCNQVKKTLIIAKIFDNFEPHYTKLEWFRPETI